MTSMERAKKVDEKNGSFLQLSYLLSELWSLKCQKWLIFVFSADDSKKLVTVRVTFLSAPEKPYRVLSENCMVTRPWGYRL